jgi:hypothetical protein
MQMAVTPHPQTAGPNKVRLYSLPNDGSVTVAARGYIDVAAPHLPRSNAAAYEPRAGWSPLFAERTALLRSSGDRRRRVS